MKKRTTREIVIKNFKRDRKFGWGYCADPTGEDAYSIHRAEHPVHTGSIEYLREVWRTDRTYQALRSAFHTEDWFYQGMRIEATYRFTMLYSPSDPNLSDDEYYDQCQYGHGWVSGFSFDDTCDDPDIRLRVSTTRPVRCWYAIEYPYGMNVINLGTQADKVRRFTSKKERDEFVDNGPAYFTDPGYRCRAYEDDNLVRRAKRGQGEWPRSI